jgi:hypothetical protein
LSIFTTSGLRFVAAPFPAGRPLSGQQSSQGADGSSVAFGVGLACATVGDGENSIVFGPPQAATTIVMAARRVRDPM